MAIIEIPPSGVVARVEQTMTLVGVYPPRTKFVNLTPHTLSVHTDAEGMIQIFAVEYGEVSGLPEPETETETEDPIVFVTSGMVNASVPQRRDVTSPGELVRDADGKPIGCKGLRK